MRSFSRSHSNRPELANVGLKVLLNLIFASAVLGIGFLFLTQKQIPVLGSIGVERLVVLALAVSVLGLVLWRAEYGVLLVILLMPLMDLYVLPFAGVNLKVSDWVAIVAIGLFFLRLPFDTTLRAPADPLGKPMIAFLLFGVISSLMMYGQIPYQTLQGAEGLNSAEFRTWTQTFWGVYSYLLYFMIYRVVRTKRILKWCVNAFLFAAVLVCLYAISGQRYWETGGGGLRVLGTFSEPSYFAAFLILVIPVAIALCLANELRITRVGQVGLVFLLLLNLALTFSTGGFIGGALVLSLILFFSIRLKLFRETNPLVLGMVVILFLTSGGIIVIATIPDASEQFTTVIQKVTNPEKSEHSAQVRARARWAAGQMFFTHPIQGVGPGNYPFFRVQYIREETQAKEYEKSLRWDPQSLYYEIASERGILGLVFFTWLVVAYFVYLSHGLKRARYPYDRALLAALIVGSIGLFVSYYAHANLFRIYVWVYMGLAVAAARLAEDPDPGKEMASPGVDEKVDPRYGPALHQNRAIQSVKGRLR